MKRLLFWVLVAALLLSPVALAIRGSRFMVIVQCGTLSGQGEILLRDRETSRGYRLDVNCSAPMPGAISFL